MVKSDEGEKKQIEEQQNKQTGCLGKRSGNPGF